MPVEIETEFLGRAELHEVVIERLFGYFHFLGRFFKGHLNKLAVLMEACVEKSPQTDFLDNLLDGSLLDARLTSLVGTSCRVVDARVTVCHNGVLSHSLKAKKL